MTRETGYPTLAKVVEELRPMESLRLNACVVDPITGDRFERTIPAVLFRGESEIFPSICSSRYRFERDTRISEHHKSIIDRIGGKLDEWLQKDLSNMGSASLLQHYGFPTEVIDTTSSIEVAASFAISAQRCDQPGRILTYPTDKLMNNAIVIDLSMIKWARRPRRQHGFMIFHRECLDWQHEHLVKDVQVKEHRFIGSAEDRRRFDKSKELIGSPSEDPVSALLHVLVHKEVLKGAPELPKEVSEWLEERIPWTDVPVPTIAVSWDSNGRPVELKLDFDKF